MSYKLLFFIFLIIFTVGVSADSFAVKSAGKTTVQVPITPGQTHSERWGLMAEKTGVYTITATGNGTRFVDIPDEMNLTEGTSDHWFDITLPSTATSGVYVVDMYIVQKDVKADTGGNIMIEAAKKVWHIRPDVPQQQQSSSSVEEEKEPVKVTPKAVPKATLEKTEAPPKVQEKAKEPVKDKQDTKDETVEKTEDVKITDKIKTTVITSSTTPTPIESPLKQLKAGVIAHEVQCSEGKELHISYYRERVLCITEETFESLKARGWIFDI